MHKSPQIIRLARWAAVACIACAVCATAAERGASQWVYRAQGGRLMYKTTPAGDRIMDFSSAGYRGGGVSLPDVPVKRTVSPSNGEDDAARIQAAINEVSALPLEGGFRGAVLLTPGTFSCASIIAIEAEGVVLRGSGSEKGGTTIRMTGAPHVALTIGSTARRPRSRSAERAAGGKAVETTVIDAYVPSGATSFHVADGAGLALGDSIAIRHPVTAAWVKFMQMDDLTRDGKPQTWIKTGATVTTERTIASISGNTITLNVPLSDSFDAKYLNPPGTKVEKLPPSESVSQSGIEHLHIECPPQAINHTEAHFSAMRIDGRDCWAQDVAADETMNSVGVTGMRITLAHISVNRKAKHQGSSKPAEFAPNGTQVLLDRCSVTADNVWFAATGAGVAGPVVLLNCTFKGDGSAEAHQRWSTGLLYDNCVAPDGAIEFRNRGAMGSGHGWTMGWGVAWNCRAKAFLVQNPPGALNWMIGCIGKTESAPRPFDKSPDLAGGTIDSLGTPVAPQSLYLAQLLERLGPQALKNIGYDPPQP